MLYQWFILLQLDRSSDHRLSSSGLQSFVHTDPSGFSVKTTTYLLLISTSVSYQATWLHAKTLSPISCWPDSTPTPTAKGGERV